VPPTDAISALAFLLETFSSRQRLPSFAAIALSDPVASHLGKFTVRLVHLAHLSSTYSIGVLFSVMKYSYTLYFIPIFLYFYFFY
jgi:hypothetical protein